MRRFDKFAVLLAAMLNVASGLPAWTADGPITAAALTPDETGVVVAHGNSVEFRAWPSLEIRKWPEYELAPLGQVIDQIHDLVFSWDGTLLLIAGGTPGDHGQMVLMKWPDMRVALQSGHRDLIYRTCVRQSDGLIASASADRTIAFKKAGGKPKSLVGHSQGVTSVAFVPDTSLVISGSLDQSIRLWDVETQNLVRTLDNHTGAIHDLSLRPGARERPWIASAGADRTVRFWQPTIGRLIRFARLPAEPLDIDWLNSGESLVCACSDGHVRVIDPETADVTADLPAIDGWAYTIAAPKSGRQVLVGGERRQLRTISIPGN